MRPAHLYHLHLMLIDLTTVLILLSSFCGLPERLSVRPGVQGLSGAPGAKERISA